MKVNNRRQVVDRKPDPPECSGPRRDKPDAGIGQPPPWPLTLIDTARGRPKIPYRSDAKQLFENTPLAVTTCTRTSHPRQPPVCPSAAQDLAMGSSSPV